MVIRVKIRNEESDEEHEVTAPGDFSDFYLKVLDLVKEEVKNERRAQREEAGLNTGRLRTLFYTNPEVESKTNFGFAYIFDLINKEIYSNRLKLTEKETDSVRTMVNRLADNNNDRLERIADGLFRIIPEKDFFSQHAKESV